MTVPRFNLRSAGLVAIMLFSTTISFSQNISSFPGIDLTAGVTRINFLGVAGFGYEKGIGKGFTFRPEAGLGWPVITDEHSTNDDISNLNLEYLLNPYILMEGRYYYNLNKRNLADKPTANFSGNYIGAFYRYNVYQYLGSYSSDDVDTLLHNVHYFGAWWGMQRNLGEAQFFYFNLSFGPGLETDFNSYGRFNMEGHLGLGIQW